MVFRTSLSDMLSMWKDKKVINEIAFQKVFGNSPSQVQENHRAWIEEYLQALPATRNEIESQEVLRIITITALRHLRRYGIIYAFLANGIMHGMVKLKNSGYKVTKI